MVLRVFCPWLTIVLVLKSGCSAHVLDGEWSDRKHPTAGRAILVNETANRVRILLRDTTSSGVHDASHEVSGTLSPGDDAHTAAKISSMNFTALNLGDEVTSQSVLLDAFFTSDGSQLTFSDGNSWTKKNSTLDGDWEDPHHPHGTRHIHVDGWELTLTGNDGKSFFLEKSKLWKSKNPEPPSNDHFLNARLLLKPIL